jgi:hypothetical protein
MLLKRPLAKNVISKLKFEVYEPIKYDRYWALDRLYILCEKTTFEIEALMKGLPAFENLETYEANPCCALSQGILSNPKIENLSIINHIVAVGISFNLKSLKIKISDPSKFNLEAFRTSSVDKLIVEIYENRNKGSHPPFEDDLRNLASKVTEIVFKYYN